jgi:hypothetical protein
MHDSAGRHSLFLEVAGVVFTIDASWRLAHDRDSEDGDMVADEAMVHLRPSGMWGDLYYAAL